MFVNYEAMAARNEGNYYDVGWVQFLNDHKLVYTSILKVEILPFSLS